MTLGISHSMENGILQLCVDGYKRILQFLRIADEHENCDETKYGGNCVSHTLLNVVS